MTVYIARTCELCGRRQKLVNDGTFQSHKNKDKEKCPGSRLTPEEAKEAAGYIAQGLLPPIMAKPPRLNPPPFIDRRPWWKLW